MWGWGALLGETGHLCSESSHLTLQSMKFTLENHKTELWIIEKKKKGKERKDSLYFEVYLGFMLGYMCWAPDWTLLITDEEVQVPDSNCEAVSSWLKYCILE